MFFWNSLAFSMIQQMLAIWSLVPLTFLNPAWTSGSSRFTYCWSLAWRIYYSLLWSTVKGFHVVNEAEVNVFLEFPCFLYDPKNVGNLISGSSAFSKSSLNVWKFTVHVLLKPGLENFEHVRWMQLCGSKHSLASPFLGIGMKMDLF